MSAAPSNGDLEDNHVDSADRESQPPTEQPGAPSIFLQKIIGHHVTVRLDSGVDYVGILSCLDGYMNIAMEETEEFVDGVSKGRFGDAFIRGNNVLYIEAGKRS